MNSSENCQTMLRHIVSGVVIADESGEVSYLNVAAEHLTGWKSHDAPGLPVEQIVRLP